MSRDRCGMQSAVYVALVNQILEHAPDETRAILSRYMLESSEGMKGKIRIDFFRCGESLGVKLPEKVVTAAKKTKLKLACPPDDELDSEPENEVPPPAVPASSAPVVGLFSKERSKQQAWDPFREFGERIGLMMANTPLDMLMPPHDAHVATIKNQAVVGFTNHTFVVTEAMAKYLGIPAGTYNFNARIGERALPNSSCLAVVYLKSSEGKTPPGRDTCTRVIPYEDMLPIRFYLHHIELNQDIAAGNWKGGLSGDKWVELEPKEYDAAMSAYKVKHPELYSDNTD